MRRYLLDTGIAADYINRRHGVYERARAEVARGNRIGISVPVLAELYYGIEFSESREKNMQRLHVAPPSSSASTGQNATARGWAVGVSFSGRHDSSALTQRCGTARRPCTAPSRAPAMAAFVSVSPPAITVATTPSSKLAACSSW